MVSLKELRAEAKEKGVKGFSRLSKAELEAALGHAASTEPEVEHKEAEPKVEHKDTEAKVDTEAKPKEKKPSKPNAWREYARSYQAEHKIEKFKDALVAAGPSWHAMKGKEVKA